METLSLIIFLFTVTASAAFPTTGISVPNLPNPTSPSVPTAPEEFCASNSPQLLCQEAITIPTEHPNTTTATLPNPTAASTSIPTAPEQFCASNSQQLPYQETITIPPVCDVGVTEHGTTVCDDHQMLWLPQEYVGGGRGWKWNPWWVIFWGVLTIFGVIFLISMLSGLPPVKPPNPGLFPDQKPKFGNNPFDKLNQQQPKSDQKIDKVSFPTITIKPMKVAGHTPIQPIIKKPDPQDWLIDPQEEIDPDQEDPQGQVAQEEIDLVDQIVEPQDLAGPEIYEDDPIDPQD